MIESQYFRENFFNHSFPNLRGDYTEQLLKEHLSDPARNLLARPKKSLRSKLVRLGYDMAKELAGPDGQIESFVYEENLGHVETAIELIHTGSLIIDDIQDQSEVRRGSNSLHTQIGIPKSISVGNWLYFSPITYLQRSLIFNEHYKYSFIEAYFKTMEEAHCGQALDISIEANKVRQNQIRDLVQRISLMKTGSLTRLALVCGALCFRRNLKDLRILEEVGENFGAILQAFDDIGNMQGSKEPDKKLEDVKKNRVSFILSAASENFTSDEYQKLASFFGKPDIDQEFEKFSSETYLRKYCDLLIEKKLSDFIEKIEKKFSTESKCFTEMKNLCEELKHAYTN